MIDTEPGECGEHEPGATDCQYCGLTAASPLSTNFDTLADHWPARQYVPLSAENLILKAENALLRKKLADIEAGNLGKFSGTLWTPDNLKS